MATKYVSGRLKHIYDTSSALSSDNPVLLAGEIGIESDTLKMKIGDGSTEWNSLNYTAGGGGITMTVSDSQPASDIWIDTGE